MIRSLAAPISMAPDAETRASTWNSAPSIPSRREVAVGHQGGEQHGRRGPGSATSTLKPSTTTAWSTAVKGPWACTSAHCHRAKPSEVAETSTVAGGGHPHPERPADQRGHGQQHAPPRPA